MGCHFGKGFVPRKMIWTVYTHVERWWDSYQFQLCQYVSADTAINMYQAVIRIQLINVMLKHLVFQWYKLY